MQGWVEAGMCRAGLGGGRDVQGWVDGYGDVSIGGGGGLQAPSDAHLVWMFF